jgi:hydrogenase/urease accessory protein HupE
MNALRLLAHAGQVGDHGWLAGALQPLLGVDHLVAAIFVAVLLSLGLTRVVRRGPAAERAPPR